MNINSIIESVDFDTPALKIYKIGAAHHKSKLKELNLEIEKEKIKVLQKKKKAAIIARGLSDLPDFNNEDVLFVLKQMFESDIK